MKVHSAVPSAEQARPVVLVGGLTERVADDLVWLHSSKFVRIDDSTDDSIHNILETAENGVSAEMCARWDYR